MDVEVDDGRPPDGSLGQERPEGHRGVVEEAEALAVARVRVVEPAAEVPRRAVIQRQATGEERAAAAQGHGVPALRGERDLQPEALGQGEGVLLDLPQIRLGVGEKELLAGGGLGRHEVPLAHRVVREQALPGEPVLGRDEDVRTQIDLVARVPHQRWRVHGCVVPPSMGSSRLYQPAGHSIFRAMELVTGGTGFIGSNLVGRLAEEGVRVSVNDTLGRGEKWRNIARHEIDELVDPRHLDDFLERRGDEIERVYHLGAISSTTETDADLVADSNLRLSQRIWRWCAGRGVPLVYASSAATYGDGSAGFEDDDGPEALARLLPLNAYGWSKHAFDRWVAREVVEGRPAPPLWVGLKLFNVYGPNEYHKGDMRSVVTKAYASAERGKAVTLFRSHHPDYGDGRQKRDFVYVRDCVDVMLWLRHGAAPSGIYNLGTGRAQTWLELMGALFEAVGKPLQVSWIDIPEEIRERYQYFTEADMTKLREAGYDRPFASVEEGVTDYVERYLSQGDPYR